MGRILSEEKQENNRNPGTSTPDGWRRQPSGGDGNQMMVFTRRDVTQDIIDIDSVAATGPAVRAVKLSQEQVKDSRGVVKMPSGIRKNARQKVVFLHKVVPSLVFLSSRG
jgi:hypothetical protein